MLMSAYHFIISFHKNNLIKYASMKLQCKPKGKPNVIREFSQEISIALYYSVSLF